MRPPLPEQAAGTDAGSSGPPLPPGQRDFGRFPRFGTHLARPAPPVPSHPGVQVTGAVKETVSLSAEDLAALPRVERVADFHCVSGWSATNLRWEGVDFATFYREVVEPALLDGATVTHLGFGGLDGYRSVVMLEDALAGDVLIADRLNGRSLDTDHGAPLRLVSPSQYGYMSTKHLCRIEVHTTAPVERYRRTVPLVRWGLRVAIPHPRARVWLEERHPHLPPAAVRPIYRLLIRPIAALSERGSRRPGD